MKASGKSTLVLIEFAVMLLVFALAAAFCLQAFRRADRLSGENEYRDEILLQAQNAIELLKHHKGDLRAVAEELGGDMDGRSLHYIGAGGMQLRMTLLEGELDLLGEAIIEVTDSGGEVILTLPAAWQED